MSLIKKTKIEKNHYELKFSIDKETFEKAKHILETIGNPEKVTYMGPSGAGDAMKCINNYVSCNGGKRLLPLSHALEAHRNILERTCGLLMELRL